jgi:hypothetical protein
MSRGRVRWDASEGRQCPLRFGPVMPGYTHHMELLLILVLVAVAVTLILGARRRRHFNRGRGAITGRWNRRV